MTEKQIESLLKKLNKEQLMQFFLSCIERTLGLYKSMEECNGKFPKSKNYDSVVAIVKFIKQDIHTADKSKIKAQIKKCDNILDYLEEEDLFPAVCIVQSIADCIIFYIDEDIDKISCIEYNLEIINQLKSDEYTNTVNAKASNDELQTYLNPFFEKELQIEFDTIEMIKNNAIKSDLALFIQNNNIDIPIFVD